MRFIKSSDKMHKEPSDHALKSFMVKEFSEEKSQSGETRQKKEQDIYRETEARNK